MKNLAITIFGTFLAIAGMAFTVYNISLSRDVVINGIFFVWNAALFCYWINKYRKWCDETWG